MKEIIESLVGLQFFATSLRNDKNEVPIDYLEAYERAEAYFSEINKDVTNSKKAEILWEEARDQPASLLLPRHVQDLKLDFDLAKYTLESYKAQQKLQLEEDITSLTENGENIESRIATLVKQMQNALIVSPLNGFIEVIKVCNVGDYILSGEEIVRVIPPNIKGLKVDISVGNSQDIAEIKEGMPFHLRFEALPPVDFGELLGVISQVPSDAKIANGISSIFLVEGSPMDDYLLKKNNMKVYLMAGMSGEATIVIRHQRIIRFILEKLDFFR